MEYYKPNDGNKIYLTQFSIIIEDQFIYLPYSVASLWAAAEKNKIVSRNELKHIFFYREPIDNIIKKFDNPTLVGFSNYIWNENYNDILASKIKEKYPNCLIVYGGPQVPDDQIEWYNNRKFIDVCVHQEGEITFSQILKNKKFKDIDGITYNTGKEWIKTSPSKRIKNLDNIPSPYLLGIFDKLVRPKNLTLNAIFEFDRGCPYQCTFCDWGGTIFSKIEKINLDRIYKEIEWAGKNKIDMFYSANANFGIFKKRDEDIVNKLIETNKKYSYPKSFDTSWAKNSNKFIVSLAKKLHDVSLLRKYGVSFQSLNSTVLQNIKRTNLKINDFSGVIELTKQYQMNIMVELIVGLPGETLNSWIDNYSKLMENDNLCIESYPCTLLNNSELTKFINKYNIKYKKVKLENTEIPEYAKQIVSTDTITSNEMTKVWQWTWCARLGHTLGITNEIVKFLFNKGYSVKEFYNNWFDFIANSKGILNKKFNKWNVHLTSYNFQKYIFEYDYLNDIGRYKRNETLIDLKVFLETYYKQENIDILVNLFDVYHYTPEYNYPRTINNITVTHHGMGSIKNYSSFIGLNRKNKGWQCGIVLP